MPIRGLQTRLQIPTNFNKRPASTTNQASTNNLKRNFKPNTLTAGSASGTPLGNSITVAKLSSINTNNHDSKKPAFHGRMPSSTSSMKARS